MGAFQTGTVANHREFMTTLYDFLTGSPGTPGRDWTSLMYENTKNNASSEPFGSNCKQFVLKNVGVSSTEVVIIGFRGWEYSAGGAYGMDLNGYITWTTGQLWNDNSGDHGFVNYDATWHRFSKHPQLPLMNDSMQYWFVSNQQRVFIAVKTASYYQSAYLGFGNRFGTPSQYPYPLLVIGSLYTNLLYSDTSSQHTFILRPYITSAEGNIWCVDASNIYSSKKTSMGALELIPSNNDFGGYLGGFVRGDYHMRKILFPVYVIMDSQLLMSLDGVYFNHSDSVSPEDLVIYNAKKHYLFSNVNRITYSDFLIVNTDVTGSTTTTTTTTTAP